MERIASSSELDHLSAHDVEREAEAILELLLPLLHQAARCNHKTAVEVTAQHELADVEPGHDRLACPWVIGQQEPKWLHGEESTVDGIDLVRQRVDGGCLKSGKGVEEVGQLDPPSL